MENYYQLETAEKVQKIQRTCLKYFAKIPESCFNADYIKFW